MDRDELEPLTSLAVSPSVTRGVSFMLGSVSPSHARGRCAERAAARLTFRSIHRQGITYLVPGSCDASPLCERAGPPRSIHSPRVTQISVPCDVTTHGDGERRQIQKSKQTLLYTYSIL